MEIDRLHTETAEYLFLGGLGSNKGADSTICHRGWKKHLHT